MFEMPRIGSSFRRIEVEASVPEPAARFAAGFDATILKNGLFNDLSTAI
jgi:hypothetical protein